MTFLCQRNIYPTYRFCGLDVPCASSSAVYCNKQLVLWQCIDESISFFCGREDCTLLMPVCYYYQWFADVFWKRLVYIYVVCSQRQTIAVNSWRGSLASRLQSISTSWMNTTDSWLRLVDDLRWSLNCSAGGWEKISCFVFNNKEMMACIMRQVDNYKATFH